MTAFKFRMGSGIPGDVTRHNDAKIEANQIDDNTPPVMYGDPVKLDSGKIQPIGSGDAAADVYGLLVRPYPTNSSTDGVGTSTPPDVGIADVLKSGYINVLLRNGTAARGGAVYVRQADATSEHPLGGIEAGADGGDCVAITGAYFTGAADDSGVTEIAYNL